MGKITFYLDTFYFDSNYHLKYTGISLLNLFPKKEGYYLFLFLK